MVMDYVTRLAGKIVRAALDKDLPPPTDRELSLLAEAKRSFLDLQGAAAKDASQCHDEWLSNVRELRRLALEEDLRSFLRWYVVHKTMFTGNALWTVKELRCLKRQRDYTSRWRSALRESPVGNPPPYVFARGTSGTLIHHAYSLARFETLACRSMQDMDFVVEFGGGYGSMCRLFHQLGFNGVYVLFDLPEFSVLQTYYLSCLGLPVQKQSQGNDRGIYCVSALDRLQSLVSNRNPKAASLFLAMWSFSESPLALRHKIWEIVRELDCSFFAYQKRFGEIGNVEFFECLRRDCAGMEWHEEAIGHLSGNSYLAGVRKGILNACCRSNIAAHSLLHNRDLAGRPKGRSRCPGQ